MAEQIYNTLVPISGTADMTLASAITNTQTTITVNALPSHISAATFRIRVSGGAHDEFMTVTDISSAPVLTVTRESENATQLPKVAHPINSGVYLVATVAGLQAGMPFLQAGTGAVQRTMQAKAREILSLADFGPLTDDDTGDNTTTIQNWINEGIALGGAVLTAPPGIFRYGSPLTINMGVAGAGLTIKGSGRGVSVFHQAGGSSIDGLVLGATGAEVADNMYLSDFTLTGGRYAIRLNNVLAGVFDRLALTNGVVGLYFEGQNESLSFRDINIDTHSQNGILTGQANGGSISVLNFPEIQKCSFERVRVANITGTAVVITAGIIDAVQQVSGNLDFKVLTIEGCEHNQLDISFCDLATTFEHVTIEAATLAAANTYDAVSISAGSCNIDFRACVFPGRANDGTTFRYSLRQAGGLVQLRNVITGAGGAAGTKDILLGDAYRLDTVYVTSGSALAVNNPDRGTLSQIIDTNGNIIVKNKPVLAYRNQVVVDGPTAYWRMSSLSGNLSDLISGAACVALGAPAYEQPGLIGSDTDPAIAFVGGTGFTISSPVTILAAGGSIECLFRLNAFDAVILGISSHSDAFLQVQDATTIRLAVPSVTPLSWTVPTMTVGNIYHLVLTRDSISHARVYLNGVESSTGDQPSSGDFTPDQIARYFDGGSGHNVDGILDEIALYPYQLTARQVQAHYLMSVLPS